jgi:hypothetical protein
MVTGQVNMAGRRVAWVHRCIDCGQVFFSRRKDASTCTPACRQRIYRRRQKTGRANHRQRCVQLGLPIPKTGWDYAKVVYELG